MPFALFFYLGVIRDRFLPFLNLSRILPYLPLQLALRAGHNALEMGGRGCVWG